MDTQLLTDPVAIAQTIVFAVVIVVLVIWGYIRIPIWFSGKYRARTPEETAKLLEAHKEDESYKLPPEKCVTVGFKRAVLGRRGDVPLRMFMGIDLKVGSNNLTDYEHLNFEDRTGDELQMGGRMTRVIRILDKWMFKRVGYHLLAENFLDLFNPRMNLQEVDLGRVDVVPDEKFIDTKPGSKWKNAKKLSDKTNMFRSSLERIDGVSEEIDTGKDMKGFGPDGKATELPQRVPLVVKYQLFYKLENMPRMLAMTGGKFPSYVLEYANSAFRDVIGGKGYDELLKPSAKDEICAAVMKIIEPLLKAIGLKEDSIQIEDFFVTDPRVRKALQDQGLALVEGQASLTAAQYALQKSGLTKQTDQNLAEGQAAYPLERLKAIAAGGKAIKEELKGDVDVTRDILVADAYSQTKGTLFVNAGGLGDRGPMPVVPFTPDQNGSTAKEAGGKK